jgi:non-specific serine/threonine protein kinase/serine/threonine-protein kinase
MTMTPDRYEQVRSLFISVCEMNEPQRSAALSERCANDEELRREVEALLAAESNEDDLLRESRLGIMADVVQAAAESAAGADDEAIGTIEKYRIIRKIGSGGMGTVFEAEQEHPRRTVALKLMRAGVSGGGMLRRFAHEAHVLGLLQHPGIAQIYDAGTAETSEGAQPFFVMELVMGEPLTEYAKNRNLSTRARLEIVAQVAEAVHHAHTKGVIHRDLKPANILVVEDGRPIDHSTPSNRLQPKVLDFGVARAIDANAMATTLHTDVGQLIGTVPYMSPEQASGDTDQIDTRSDVYSLGVVCYELLTNRLPLDVHQVKLHEAVRKIREEEPVRLSSVNRAFRGDVETIIGKALDKDKEQRYQSAADFAADIRRYLNDEPIQARPQSAMYQLRKFARRNRALVGGAITVVLVLVAGMAATTYWLLEAVAQRDRAQTAEELAKERLVDVTSAKQRAELEAGKAMAVRDFLVETLSSADPEIAQGRDLTVRELLDLAAVKVQDTLQQRPEVLGEVADVIGWTYYQLAEYSRAEPLLRFAMNAREETLGPEHRLTVESVTRLAEALREIDRSQEATSLLQQALATSKSVFGANDPLTLQCMTNLASLHRAQDHQREAEEMLLEVVRRYREADRTHLPSYLVALNNLGSLTQATGRPAEAMPILEEAVSRSRQINGNDHRHTLAYEKNLALALNDLGRLDEAEPLLRHVLEVRDRTLAPDHPATLTARNSIVDLLMSRGAFADARDLAERNLVAARARLGDDHTQTLTYTSVYATACIRNGNFDVAETVLRDLLPVRKRVSGERSASTITAMSNLAYVLLQQGKLDEAATLYAEICALSEHVYPSDAWQHGVFALNYGQCLRKLDRPGDAEPCLLKAFEVLRIRLGPRHERTRMAITSLIELYESMGQSEKAEKYRSMQPE